MSKKFAFIFPGQGSQSVGMLAKLAASHPEVGGTFATASDALGYDLWKLVQEGPESELMATERTQPMMLAAGVAVWRVWRAQGGKFPSLLAGHSLGEYTALVCAGALDFAEAVSLVADRGRFMQEALPRGAGAIAAILGLDDQRVVELCEAAAEDEVVSAVNFNAPSQVVVAGHAGAVDRALKLAKAAGAKRAVMLPMSVAAHCPLMKAANERLRRRLAGIRVSAPSIPIIHNVDLSRRGEPDGLREVLARQLYSPVRWADTVRLMAGEGIEMVIECGPGKVLSGLNKRIERKMTALPVFDDAGLSKALKATGSLDAAPVASSMSLKPALQYTGG